MHTAIDIIDVYDSASCVYSGLLYLTVSFAAIYSILCTMRIVVVESGLRVVRTPLFVRVGSYLGQFSLHMALFTIRDQSDGRKFSLTFLSM